MVFENEELKTLIKNKSYLTHDLKIFKFVLKNIIRFTQTILDNPMLTISSKGDEIFGFNNKTRIKENNTTPILKSIFGFTLYIILNN